MRFFFESIEWIASVFDVAMDLPMRGFLVPVGISFYTLQSMGYVIDVYHRKIQSEKHFGLFALYVAFFPKLAAGPIERAQHLLPQFRQVKAFDCDLVYSGLRTILWGAFKKIVVADRIAIMVNTVYNAPESFGRWAITLATFLFAIQIYCDFSGYTDIAIGSAKILGYDLMANFRFPYFASTFRDFWRRWHISLSTWFRDYVYIPLGGNRVTKHRWLCNILIVFAISGLWHGTNWTFVIWGILHAVYLICEATLHPFVTKVLPSVSTWKHRSILTPLRTLYVFVFVSIGWIFFRASSLREVGIIMTRLLSNEYGVKEILNLGLPPIELLFSCYGIIVLLVVDVMIFLRPYFIMRLWQHRVVRWTSYAIAIYSIVFFGAFDGVDFIYFQF